MEASLHLQIPAILCADPAQWAIDYVARPSFYLSSPQSPFYPDIRQLADAEIEFIQSSADQDGIWPVTWSWGGAYPEAWPVSCMWNQAQFAITYMLYLQGFGVCRS